MNATTTFPTFTTEVFKTMTDNFNKAFQAGVKAQEDVFRTFTDATTRTTDEFRNRVERFADELAPVTKKNAERFTRLFDEQTQRTTSFFRTTSEQSPVAAINNPNEALDRTMSFWKNAFDVTRESVEAFNKAGQDAWQNVTQCGKSYEAVATDTATRKPVAK